MKQPNRVINKSEDYIEEHIRDKITLQNLADHVHMSVYHFHRIFKKGTNETVQQFILRIKLERSAVYLLVNQNVSITEIAYAYGFYDASAYCRAFKTHFKVTPSQFRK